MRKRILLMLCIVLCVLGLAACGTDPKSIDYNGFSYEDLENSSKSVWTSLQELDKQGMDEYILYVENLGKAERKEFMAQNENQEINYNLIKNWAKVLPQVGEFKEIESFDITMSGKTTTTELTLQFEKRPVLLTHVYDNYTMKTEDITLDIVYTTGEKMQKAGLNTLMGMGTVFIMLIIISLIISCFGFIFKLENKIKQNKQPVYQTVNQPAAPASVPEPETVTNDLELAAVIAAAIASSTGQSADDFVVRSIKRR